MRPLLLTGAALLALAGPAAAQQAPAHDMADMPGMDMSHMDHSHMPGMKMAGGLSMGAMQSALGPYGMTRDASGTSWQPDASRHDGLMADKDGWSLMGHALFNAVYDSQSGPRGGDKAFVSGMVMLMASRPLSPADTLQLRAMLSPDPVMGASGYPLLLATGETADGKAPLIDRQHPHDLIMELSASLSHRFGARDSLFVYTGLPGEPAFGPPAFMHRQSAMDSPEAPVSHHWLDSTHVTFGVITGGWVHGPFKLEGSLFKGREPDQHRYDIETPRLDSQAVRISYNPDAHWSLQASWAHLTSPEQLEPRNNEDRWSVSAIYTRRVGAQGSWSTTAAYGSKRLSQDGHVLGAWLLESAFKPNDPWTVFARAEGVRNQELLAPAGIQAVAKLSVGAIRDWRATNHVKLGIGALYAVDFVPSALGKVYGDSPHGAMAFARLKVD